MSKNTQVIGYDNTNGTYSSRLWWMLRWVGHHSVAVLDGGWDGWIDGGHPVTDLVPPPKPATFVPAIDNTAVVDSEFILNNIGKDTYCVIDARANDRFHGKNETIDPVAGHIPEAINRFFKENLDASSRFKSAAALRKEWEAVLAGRSPAQIINQCGTGVTACHNSLAMEIAGLSGAKLYAGSWSEWIADPSRPIAVD